MIVFQRESLAEKANSDEHVLICVTIEPYRCLIEKYCLLVQSCEIKQYMGKRKQ